MFYHGMAIAKREISFIDEEFSWGYFRALPPPPEVLKIGEVGAITAYLPEYEKFAISLSNGAHITFTMSEEDFKNIFDVRID